MEGSKGTGRKDSRSCFYRSTDGKLHANPQLNIQITVSCDFKQPKNQY